MLDDHLVVIPQLAAGMHESIRFIDSQSLDQFMFNMLRSRIGRRVLAEQHIALSNEYVIKNHPELVNELPEDAFALMDDQMSNLNGGSRIGIIYTHCSARKILDKCVRFAQDRLRQQFPDAEMPGVVINGFPDVKFLYIPEQLEYILFELLANAFEHQLLQHLSKAEHASPTKCPPIEITVAPCPSPESLTPDESLSQKMSGDPMSLPAGLLTPKVTSITFRISDQGGGIPKSILPPDQPWKIWSFAHHHQLLSISESKPDGQTMAGGPLRILLPGEDGKEPRLAGKLSDPPSVASQFKIGLQLAKIFANYWGGELQIHTMEGYGTDAYIRIVTSGEDQERLTVDTGEWFSTSNQPTMPYQTKPDEYYD